jgi:hypothetical protein
MVKQKDPMELWKQCLDAFYRKYVEKKVMLLRESNIRDESEIASRVWECLDAVLMMFVRNWPSLVRNK